jgi:hypothetical protein
MTSAPSTDKVVLFPPPVESVAVSHSGAASCCHNLDDPSCDCDDNDSGTAPSPLPDHGAVFFDTHSETVDEDISRELDNELQKIIRDSQEQ